MHAHLFSFYLPSLEESAAVIEITGEEHRHLARVLRMKPGESVRATDGRGLAVAAVIETIGADVTRARVTKVEERGAPKTRLVLALPILQRAHFEAAVLSCVEVGATEFIPVSAEKCHAREWTSSTRARTDRVAISAMKQSGRSWLPPTREPVSVAELARCAGEFGRVALGDASGRAEVPGSRGDTLAIVGPEGGFTPAEETMLVEAGAVRVSLAAHRLRAETAAVVLIAALVRAV